MSWIPMGAHTVPACVRPTRRWLVKLLESGPSHVREVTDDAALLLSETLTNAIRYGIGPSVTCSMALCPSAVHVEVTNRAGSDLPHVVRDADAEHGRGLPILAALAQTWGYRRLLQDHLSVWFLLETKPPARQRPPAVRRS
ncbi:ATP-binding protein [Actinomadura viridis]|uniref:ATP-binding protein n=1 Tax=Actinomadura viridis TaxID=58110 RepID=UPI00369B7403